MQLHQKWRLRDCALILLVIVLLMAAELNVGNVYSALRCPEDPIRFPLYEQIGSRAAALDREPNAPPRVLIVGPSSVRWGLRGLALQEGDSGQRNWYVFGGQGRSFAKLRYYSAPVLRTVRPQDTLVIATHLFHAGGEAAPRCGSLLDLARPAVTGSISAILNHYLWSFRESWLATCGQSLTAVFPYRRDARDLDPTAEEGALPRVQAHGQQPVFEWTRVSVEQRQAEWQALQALLAEAQQLRCRLILMLMPETDAVREGTPPRLQARLEDLLQKFLIPCLDLRDSYPDQDFVARTHLHPSVAEDLSHMARQGILSLFDQT
jgi:hypothetical protein